eukprot:8165996-Alexandrium_andersonii.AAC.1
MRVHSRAPLAARSSHFGFQQLGIVASSDIQASGLQAVVASLCQVSRTLGKQEEARLAQVVEVLKAFLKEKALDLVRSMAHAPAL